ncbi:MAG: hypothetical protein ACSHYB_12365 [Roseibacillus sp.]
MHFLALCFISLAAFSQALGEAKSFYSSTASKFVALVESSEFDTESDIDHFKEVCPGYGGYELLYEGGDARSWMNVRYGEKESDLWGDTMGAARGFFPYKSNDVVEWRGIVENGRFKPYAIIYRISADNPDSEKPGKSFSTLLVIALKKGESSLLGTASGEDENAKAQKIADDWWKRQKQR